jgi:NAD-dependent deacetylase
MPDLPRINFTVYRSIVILTGAGVSAASGMRPFLGPGGLWNDPDTIRLSESRTLYGQPGKVWAFYGELRTLAAAAPTNPAHEALARLEDSLRSDQQLTLLTLNVDGLHQRAGSRQVIELHGSVFRTRCSNDDCSLPGYMDYEQYPQGVPRCPRCNAVLRPDIVLFGEKLPVEAMWLSRRALRSCDLFMVIGTSGLVAPASDFVRVAEHVGARTILIDQNPMNPQNPYFHEEYTGKAEEILPEMMPSFIP